MSIEENVFHPSHYGGKDNPYETIKVIEAWGLDDNFDLGNTIKYISRAGKKDKACLLQDLMKAQFYLNHEVEKLHKYDGNYELMKAEERKARLLDEKKELEEDLDDLQSRFAGLQADVDGVIDVNVDELIKAVNKAVNKYKEEISKKDKEIANADDSNACDCGHAEEYACKPDECKKCNYSGNDNSYTGCAAYITMPDEISDALDAIANHFLGTDDYYVDFNDDGSITIAYCDDDDTEDF